jgi:sugar lactone lactonase YvrE
MLARYTTESVVGRGGMSVVYAAHDRRLDRRVALKVMQVPAGADARARERFLRESRLAASIDHPNVIPIYDAGETDAGLYIAMRLVAGSDLRQLLRREGALGIERTLAIVAGAADALDTAHARGLLHRDVKPANILLAADDGEAHVYLSDFGLAVPGGGDATLDNGGFQGTADYAAPEQIGGQPEPRSDVYALACVLFECLTGEPPFGRGRLLETLWRHLNESPPRLSQRRPGCPLALDAVLASALAKDPAERPATCGELVSQARAAAGLERPARRHRRLLPAAAAIVFAVAAALALVVRDGDRPPAAAGAPADGVIMTLAGTGERGAGGDGGPAARATITEPISLAVDRGTLYVAEAGGRIRRIDRAGAISTLAARGDSALSPGWWPSLAVDANGRLYVLDRVAPQVRRMDRGGSAETLAGTGRPGFLGAGPRTVSRDLCPSAGGPALDPSGRVYVVCPTAHRVVRIDPGGVLTTVAGSGAAGYSGDDGAATDAALNGPTGIAFDRRGNLYIADFLNERVRKVDRSGVITTFAGTGGRSLSGDGWRASSIDVWGPLDVAADDAGNVYILESATNRVRKVDRRGIITTIAGTGRAGYSGDGGPGARAELDHPGDIAVAADGTVYIADTENNRVRKVLP